MIVAVAENGVIGRNNSLPWYLPNDLKYFKQTTMGKPVIMGRKTYESIGKPLPGRTNIVITRQADYQPEGVKVVNSVEAAKELAESVCLIDGQDEAMIMGGAEIYALSLPYTDRLYLTEVHADVQGDAFFPEYDKSRWQEVAREDFAAEGPNPYSYSFVVYEAKA
ncbi:MAG: dihydrofolate reductase [Thalassolituus sp.]|jgi:dihydrofolate reductase|uniref:dihydrofolate reductase n=1 Tax=unclassified Thalassolituus TaxID=2624967 RepID=UPI000B6B0C97|nr:MULTISPECIES: dihydrofolate reductase [unclassified Thalassolituus]MBN56486.1 dihydrofolate reductase [Oceanospirillaceae bacterium]MDQ4424276.1 dihydrofolate reductase [Thalassolituus sp.]MDQ4425002.1 dihydrofolate reductase [Thalassolituus sp.]OUX66014.1 MAG: dihydrofolate reductase [Oceanospirillaceae bacterium TMED276]|tara:strand:- start:1232 stop:1726 length:495 start_codon:yes stop_codon:yes gene_type:complete